MEPASRKPPMLVTMPSPISSTRFTRAGGATPVPRGAYNLALVGPWLAPLNTAMAPHAFRVLAAGVLAGLAGLVTSALHAQPGDDGQWVRAAKDYASTRYSALDQITAANVKNLKPAWTFDTGVYRGQEAAPLVVGDTMYVVTPYPNVLYALDLRRPGAVRWKYEPLPAAAAQGVACCDVVNRGAAYAGGLVVFNALDAQTVAVDARTGREVWRTTLGDVRRGETITMAPLIVGDTVLVGNSGGEMGARGWLTALDLRSGRQAWRAWSTGPDRDVLIGPAFTPFYTAEQGRDLGVSTWPSGAWKTG